MSSRHVFPVYPEPQRRKLNRRGFALPLIIIAILIPVFIIAAWAPWVTPNFAYKRIKTTIKPPCEEFKPNLSSQFLGVVPPPYHKLIFGTEYFFLIICPSSNVPNGNNYFVSFLGTTHKLSSTPNSSWGTRSKTTTTNETVYTDNGSANWKVYIDAVNKFTLKYPSNWIESNGENNIKHLKSQSSENEYYDFYIAEIGKYQDKQSFDLKAQKVFGNTKREVMQINGNDVEVGLIQGEPNLFFSILITNKNKYIWAVLSAEPEPESHRNSLNQILSTFKFL